MAAGLAWLFWRFLFHFWAGLELDSVWTGLITDCTLCDVYLPRCVRMEGRGLRKETEEGCHADIQGIKAEDRHAQPSGVQRLKWGD